MSKFVLRDGYVAVNGTALSDHASSITIEDKADEIDFTSFSPNAYREIGQGLHDATVTVTFFQDFAANSVHSILQPLYATGGTCSIEVRPTSASRSATNPALTMTSRIFSYAGISGKVGDASSFDAAFRNAGTAGPVWATA